MSLFIQYIKDTYITIIEKKISDLKNILKKNEEEINIIQKKAEDIDTFLESLKSSNDIKNSEKIEEIQNFLYFYDMCHFFPEDMENKMGGILSFKGNFQVNQYINKIMEFNENSFDEIGYDLNKNITLFILDEEKYKLRFDKDYFGLENCFINITNQNKDKEKDNENININNNQKNKLRLLIVYKSNSEIFNSIFDSKNEEKTKSYFNLILFNKENKHILFDEIKEEDEPYLGKSIKYHGISIYKNYYRAFVDKDSLIVNNDFEPKSSEDKTVKINLCLQSLSID